MTADISVALREQLTGYVEELMRWAREEGPETTEQLHDTGVPERLIEWVKYPELLYRDGELVLLVKVKRARGRHTATSRITPCTLAGFKAWCELRGYRPSEVASTRLYRVRCLQASKYRAVRCAERLCIEALEHMKAAGIF